MSLSFTLHPTVTSGTSTRVIKIASRRCLNHWSREPGTPGHAWMTEYNFHVGSQKAAETLHISLQCICVAFQFSSPSPLPFSFFVFMYIPYATRNQYFYSFIPFPHILGNNLHCDAFAKQEKVFTIYVPLYQPCNIGSKSLACNSRLGTSRNISAWGYPILLQY